MNLTVQILTKNNETTIEKCIKSLLPLEPQIKVIDLGSTDKTVKICTNLNIEIKKTPKQDFSEIRNGLNSDTEWQMYIHPWEALIQGHDQILQLEAPSGYYMSILEGTVLRKEVRLWSNKLNFKFKNPVFEHLNVYSGPELKTLIYSDGFKDHQERLEKISRWKENNTASEPFYYQACMLLALRKYEEFLKISEHFMFLDKRTTMPVILNKYYFAMLQVIYKKDARAALQNLNQCLSAKPLMAEFWCLAGDVHYHLLKDFNKAQALYENAIILGKMRLNDDKFPMDIMKYKEYPEKMIESCDKILSQGFKISLPTH